MPKSHNWFATNHLGFIKLIGHFYKMFWYFYQSKTKGRKKTEESKGEKEKQNAAQPLLASGPTSCTPAQAHEGLVVYPKQLAVEHAGGDDRHLDDESRLGLPGLPLLATTSPRSPFLLPLARLSLSRSPLADFFASREEPSASAEHHRGPAWPSPLRSRSDVSHVFPVVDSLTKKRIGRLFVPEPPESTPT